MPSIRARSTPPITALPTMAGTPFLAARIPPVAAPLIIEFHGSSFFRKCTRVQSIVENMPPHTAKFPAIIGDLWVIEVILPWKIKMEWKFTTDQIFYQEKFEPIEILIILSSSLNSILFLSMYNHNVSFVQSNIPVILRHRKPPTAMGLNSTVTVLDAVKLFCLVPHCSV